MLLTDLDLRLEAMQAGPRYFQRLASRSCAEPKLLRMKAMLALIEVQDACGADSRDQVGER